MSREMRSVYISRMKGKAALKLCQGHDEVIFLAVVRGLSVYHHHLVDNALPPSRTKDHTSVPVHISFGPELIVINMPVDTHKRRAIIPGFLYVTFVRFRPRFSVQLGRHVHIN